MNALDVTDGKSFTIRDDRTGVEVSVAQRYDVLETVRFLHELHAIMTTLERPRVGPFAAAFAIHDVCRHLGWSVADVAVVEQYAVASAALRGSAPTTG